MSGAINFSDIEERMRRLCVIVAYARARLKGARQYGIGTLEGAVDDAIAVLNEPFEECIKEELENHLRVIRDLEGT